jgi:VIT1/CCC1 family predicted Fe2+/Mn2+ transporter
VMYVMNCMTVRSGKWRLVRAVQGAPSPEVALDLIRQHVEPELEALGGQQEREALYRSILQHLAHAAPRKTRVTKEDLYGAVACFLLVFITCLPAAAPFLIFEQPTRALRVSNLLLIGMLFFIGRRWAKYANANRLLAGLAMVAIGLGLVGVAVLLGG